MAAMAACIVIFLGLLAGGDYSGEATAKFGYLSAEEVFSGGYWSLFTSVFVHFDAIHLAFNLYWLWLLGSRMEAAIGWRKFMAFYIAAAIVSSSAQLACSDDTGIGASGVVYAIFGFMALARSRHPSFHAIVNARTIQVMLIWLVGCFVFTFLHIYNIGNAAHLSGLVFGSLVAVPAILGRPVALALPSVMLLLSVLPVYWAPWSLSWLDAKAFEAYEAQDYQRAVELATRIIERDPNDGDTYRNRGLARQQLGQQEEANADFAKADEADEADH